VEQTKTNPIAELTLTAEAGLIKMDLMNFQLN